MSQQWLWRSAGECRGPLTAAELVELLRCRDFPPAGELQPVGATGWTPAAALFDVISASAAAADAVADLLLAADELRHSSPSEATASTAANAPPDRSTGGCGRTLWDLVWNPRSLLSAALFALTALVIHLQGPAPPSNAAIFAELSRCYACLADGHDAAASGEAGRRRQAALEAAEGLIADLETAARHRPLLSIGADPAAADTVLARRELLCAARDFKLLLQSQPRPAALDASLREHLKTAAELLSLSAASPANKLRLSAPPAPPQR